MKHRISFRACAAVLIAIPCGPARADETKPAENVLPQPNWKLVWKDEFDGKKLDGAKWTLCERGKANWQATMSDDPRLLKLSTGVLHLIGIVNDAPQKDPAPYLTAGVTSKGKFAFTYGKIEIRARFKCAQGAWPALWMVGEKGGWPAGGEIDLMEHLNFDALVYQTVHSAYTSKGGKTPKPGTTAKINRDGWNTYGCEWSEDKIVFTVNGAATHTYPRVPEKGDAQWPFQHPFHFILSMQIGGNWVNSSGPTNPAHYPASLEVDWVRVYQSK
jgi:beta-glucanase (GH16 family)